LRARAARYLRYALRCRGYACCFRRYALCALAFHYFLRHYAAIDGFRVDAIFDAIISFDTPDCRCRRHFIGAIFSFSHYYLAMPLLF